MSTKSIAAPVEVVTLRKDGKKKKKSLLERYWPGVTMFVVLVGLLWVGSLYFDEFIFPGPLKIWDAILEILSTEGPQILLTLGRFLLALLSAIVAGWLVGLLMGAFRNVFGRLVQPFISVIQAIPSLSWVLLVILWFSQVELRIWFVTFILAFPFFVIAVYEGIRDMDKDVLEAVEQFRPTKMQVLTKLLAPQSFVNLITVLRSTSAMTLKIMIFVELLGASNGIGQRMGLAQSSFRIDLIFGWTVILIVANFLLLRVIGLIEGKLLSWRSEAVVR